VILYPQVLNEKMEEMKIGPRGAQKMKEESTEKTEVVDKTKRCT